MIKSIAIKNYQSHIDTILDLCTGVNVITGASDAGKSSIVRAFEWNRINRPLGNAIKNWNDKEEITSVDVEFVEGIVAQKTLADTNKYTLKMPVISKLKRGNKYQETSFSALNKEIPEEITKAFDMNDVNVQPQHEKYFMLGDSPGAIAQKLNELAGLDIIDRMFKNINSFILHDKREIDRCTADIKQKEGELKSLDYIDEAKKEVQQCQELAAQAESLLKINDEMIEIEKNLRFYDNEIDKAQKVVALEKDVNSIKEKINTYNGLNAKLDEMSKLNSLLVSILNEIEDETEWVQVEDPFNEIQKMIASLKQKEEDLSIKEKQLQTLSSLDNNISRESQKLESSKEKYKEILLRMKICPVCKGKVDTKCINKIMGEL